MRRRFPYPLKGRTQRLLAVLVLVGAVSGTFATPSAGQDVILPDLAAMTLRPADVEQEEFGHGGAFMQSQEDEVQSAASYRRVEPEEVAAVLDAAGWQRKYVSILRLPSTTQAGQFNQVITSYITEYADAAGAAAAFAFLEDETDVPTAEDVLGTRTFGDQSEITRERGTGSDGRSFRSLDLTFQSGNLTAGVIFASYTATEPRLGEVEALAVILEERIGQVQTQEGGIGNAVLRLSDDRPIATTYEDAYYRLDGQDIPLWDEPAEAATTRTESYADAIDVYQIWQGIDPGMEDAYLYGATLLGFPSDDSASAWVQGLGDILDESPYFTGVDTVADATDFGDESVAFTYAGQAASRAMLIAVKVGSDVVRVQISPAGEQPDVPAAAIEEVVAAQVACIAAGACTAAMPAPEIVGIPPATPAG